MSHIESLSSVKLGLVPTHLRFVGGSAPDERGRFPRDDDGEPLLISRLKPLIARCPVRIEVVQVPLFDGIELGEIEDILAALRGMEVETQLILMLGGGHPMLPADEERFVRSAVAATQLAMHLEIEHVSATSLETWMQPDITRRDGEEYDVAVTQVAKVHRRVYEEALIADSCIRDWHIEFLRAGEFTTFTDIRRAWDVVRRANQAIGSPFFKVLVDAAHCGDSPLSIEEHAVTIADIAAADELGVFHASAKTTRGCFSTDDGWIGAMLAACARTGKLRYALAEIFHHEDDALAGLRALDPRHGVDTRDGRTYDDVVIDGLTDVARRLNNLVHRDILPTRD